MAHQDETPASVEDHIQYVCREIESHVRAVVQNLLKSAGEDRLTAVREARVQAEADASRLLSMELSRARAEAAEVMSAEINRVRDEVADQSAAEIARLRADLSDQLATEVSRVQQSVADQTTAEVARVHHYLTDQRKAEVAQVQQQLLAEKAAEVARARADVEAQFSGELARARTEAAQHLTAELARLHAEHAESLNAEVRKAKSETAESTAREISRVRAEAATAAADEVRRTRGETEQVWQTELSTARVQERQAVLAGIDRLLQVLRRLDDASSLSEVLDALAAGASEEAARVALLVVQGARVQGWQLSGFESLGDARRLQFPATEAGIVARAIETGETVSQQSAGGGETPAGPHFPPLPESRVGLAVPVKLGGRVVAVLYADDVARGARPVPSAWPEVLEILARHAGRCLEALTALKAAQPRAAAPQAARPRTEIATARPAAATSMEDEARRYASALVTDMTRRHDDQIRVGRERRDLLDRLRPQIEQARRVYEDHVPASVTGRRLYFDQELLRTLAEGDPTLLG